MTDGLIYAKKIDGPAAHALVVGVGAYPHLPGGGKRTTPYNGGMGQLTSAAVSARAFAQWLMPPDADTPGYLDPGRPIASVRMLLSEADAKPVATPDGPQPPLPATFANFTDTVKAWFAELDKDEGHLAVMYFAGHGVTAGLEEHALLLEDFGADDIDAFMASLKFSHFHLGMDRAAAREQVYFIDACRAHSPEYAATYGASGQAVIAPSAFAPRRSRLRGCPIFYATSQGASAYGRPGEMTVFTAALMEALQGGGADNPDGCSWKIDTTALQKALDYLVKRTCDRENLERAQSPSAANVTTLTLSVLAAPRVPVALTCRPSRHDEGARFRVDAPPPLPSIEWGSKDRDPLVAVGTREFCVTLAGGRCVDPVKLEVRPSYRTFQIDIPEA